MAMDVMRPFNQAGEKSKYCIVLVDLLPRYGFALAAKDQVGQTITRFLVDEVFPFSVPEAVLTDNVLNLDAGVLQELYEYAGVKKLPSTAFHPSGNGAVERLCGTLGLMIRMAVQGDGRKWSHYLPQLLARYNNTAHCAVREKPITLAFGLDPVPMASLVPRSYQEYQAQSRYMKDLIARREQAEELAKKPLEKYYADTKEDSDRKVGARPHKLFVGQ